MRHPRTTSEAAAARAHRARGRWTLGALARATFTIVTIVIVEATVCGLAAIGPALLLVAVAAIGGNLWFRAAVVAVAAAPAYLLFALVLMVLSAASTRLTGARTPPDAEMRIADMDWPLLRWARYMAACHVVRVFAGTLLRGTPVWTLYLRMNGARLGRRVYVNSLFVSDHNLLNFGHDVIIGAEVHLSGHTVEGGVVKTGRVTLGDGVTIGLCSIVEIGVEIGSRAQVGALSFVPKHTRLEGGETYVGVPVKPLYPPAILGTK